ncbi:MAG: hypothetical protein ACPLRU_09095, partial [Desulfofundulus sp.]
GYMRQVPQDDYYLYTEDQLRGQLRIALGGMAAEEVLLRSRSTGAQGDLEQAINTAKRMVAAGMCHLGIVSLSDLPEAELQAAIREILNEEKAEARRIIAEKKELVADLARELMEKERLEGEELRAKLQGGKAVCIAARQEDAGVLAS